jgi:hypothetical protein
MTQEIINQLKSILSNEVNQQKGYFYENMVKRINSNSTYPREQVDKIILGIINHPEHPWMFDMAVGDIFKPAPKVKSLDLLEDNKIILSHTLEGKQKPWAAFLVDYASQVGVDYLNSIGYSIKEYSSKEEAKLTKDGVTVRQLKNGKWVIQQSFANKGIHSANTLITKLNKVAGYKKYSYKITEEISSKILEEKYNINL